jgi:K+-transporting ATPase ATPase C chain
MTKHLRANLMLLGLTFVICSVLYPLSVLAVGQSLCPSRASGDIVFGMDGSPVGARLIGQEFQGDEWFQPRPSAVGYAANASGGSNWGANNPKLRERVEAQLKSMPVESNLIPADAVTASGSGLDPHITLMNARMQQGRVAKAWASKTGRELDEVNMSIDQLLKEHAFSPLFGLADDVPILNVLECNLELSRRLGR